MFLTSTARTTTRPPFPSLGWWIRDRDGRVVLAQPPNAAIAVWVASVMAVRTGIVEGDRADVLGHVGQGALAVWALDEVVRGASPVRRLLGAVVLPVVVWRVLH